MYNIRLMSLLYPCTMTNLKVYPHTHFTQIKIVIIYFIVSVTFCCACNAKVCLHLIQTYEHLRNKSILANKTIICKNAHLPDGIT